MLRPIVTKGVPKVVPKVFAIHARSWVALFRGSPRGFSRGVPKVVTKDFAPKKWALAAATSFFFLVTTLVTTLVTGLGTGFGNFGHTQDPERPRAVCGWPAAPSSALAR